MQLLLLSAFNSYSKIITVASKNVQSISQSYVGHPGLELQTFSSTTQLMGMTGGEAACREAHMGSICSTRKPLTLWQQHNFQGKRCLFMAWGTERSLNTAGSILTSNDKILELFWGRKQARAPAGISRGCTCQHVATESSWTQLEWAQRKCSPAFLSSGQHTFQIF